ncbi:MULTISPECIES: SPOR domain-containing protein [unclassified Polaribacter]|uniref:HU domain-containing protein n=1 Tax=unclassified Polaribacter TaxID=196858 RepID=UPI0011BFD0A0|nr:MULTISPECIES: SPOR domain-containing protein [unclassified Polaribacter]TXD54207.1 SPOR domain-containing protein [Polaribacter sp. IC063]TXD62472.1 SPOR domain-containing protein [Polaribacter sp. IC066]
MILANYINDLLYRYECVIVPNFGGFVTNKIGAKIDAFTDTFSPPSKQITFNSHLNVNDGLLANYIASSENISFEQATNAIAVSVLKWQNELQNNSLKIGSIGVLSLNKEGQIIFEPNHKVNYLADSFGLAPLTSSSIKRYKEVVKPLVSASETQNKKRVPAFIKYAASAAILLSLTFVGTTMYQQDEQKQLLAKQEIALEKKIQAATFVISNPLPTIQLNVLKEAVILKPFHVVAGAFQFPENAKKKVDQLKKQGYNAHILGVNKWGLTEVAFNSFADRNDAINDLYKIQNTVSKDAWLLLKK